MEDEKQTKYEPKPITCSQCGQKLVLIVGKQLCCTTKGCANYKKSGVWDKDLGFIPRFIFVLANAGLLLSLITGRII
jgi:hypothetical protein